jgi:hypothetical protein
MTLRLNGSTSGYTEIDAPAVAGNNTLVLPANNGTTGQFLQTNGSGGLGWSDLLETRNRMINGDMRIAQRGTSFVAIANGAYSLDRWCWGNNGAMVCTVSQSTDVPNNTFQSSCKVDVTTADSSIAVGEYVQILQRVEGYNARDLIGTTFTLSFWVKSSKTGVHCVSFRNGGNDRSYIKEYSIAAANTWEYKTLTVTGGLITAGTWNWTNGSGLEVTFTLACGTTLQTTADGWQTGNFLGTSNQVNVMDNTANDFLLTGVQLEPGTVATPFERRPYGAELILCQRYYEVVSYCPTGVTYVGNGDTRGYASFAVTKRVSPTITGFPHVITIISFTHLGEGVNLNGSILSASSSVSGFQINSMGNSVSIGGSSGGGQVMAWGDNSFRTVYASAEL